MRTGVRHLDRMIQGLQESGRDNLFEIFVLSDSTWSECIEAEEAGIERLRLRWSPSVSIHYRRRPDNPGLKRETSRTS
jgi:membrane glycosyltransferase